MKHQSAIGGAILTLTCVLSCGCGVVMRMGHEVDVSQLESKLQPGVSTRAEVRAAMGEPRCAGGMMLPGFDHPRDTWVYYYEEATFSDDHRMFLFVLFDHERYDGYLTFSSLPSTVQQEPK